MWKMKQYSYMRENLEDIYGILKLQDKILEIMVYIDQFCKEHEIKYFLMGGSALGAMRHSGFIPWDDDLDIFMDYQNYQKFIDCCKKHLDTQKYYFQEENSEELPYFFSKVRMNGTTCISDQVGVMRGHQGIFVDIMCLNNAAKTNFGKKVQYYAAGLLKAKACSKTNYKATTVIKKLQLFISKVFVVGVIKDFLLCLVRRYNNKSAKELTHLFGRAKFANSFYPKKDFEKQEYVPFETVKLAVPFGVDNYLTIRYGKNYMKMPNKETRAMYQTHAGVWDTEKDYTEYVK